MLREVPGVEAVTPAGSLRRGRETVGDLDLLVTGPAAAARSNVSSRTRGCEEVLARGENKASAKVGREGLQVDVRALPPDTLRRRHAVLHRQQGPQRRASACAPSKMGLKLSEYGLFRVDDDSRSRGRDRGGRLPGARAAVDPARAAREHAARSKPPNEGRLPELVELRHIRGDLHMHTTETDGRATLEEMAEAARERGYEYIAITDHSKALAMANGLDEKRAVEFARRVREINRRRRSASASSRGIECDILKDGAMDLANDALAELDLVIGSVHSHMNLEPAEMTDRLLRALECPHLRDPGTSHRPHAAAPRPVSRSISIAWRRRPCAAACWLEINASPERLDLSPDMGARPKRAGRGSPSRPTRIIPNTWRTCATASPWPAADGWGRRTS